MALLMLSQKNMRVGRDIFLHRPTGWLWMFFIGGLFMQPLQAQVLSPPNKKIRVGLQLSPAGIHEVASFSVGYDGGEDNVLKNALLGLETNV